MRFLLRPLCWATRHRWQAIGVSHISLDGHSWHSNCRCSRCGKKALRRYEVKCG